MFSRLGDKQVSSTSALPVAEGTQPYSGILKSPVPKPVPKAPGVMQSMSKHSTFFRVLNKFYLLFLFFKYHFFTETSSMVADSMISTNRDVQSRIGAVKEVTVVKRSATFVSVPKQEYGLKRSSSAVFASKQPTEVKRVATVAPPMKRVQGVKTAGILGV